MSRAQGEERGDRRRRVLVLAILRLEANQTGNSNVSIVFDGKVVEGTATGSVSINDRGSYHL